MGNVNLHLGAAHWLRLCWMLLVLSLPATALAEAGRLKVVIDPGHGGDKSGAVGPGGIKEKEVALAIALALEAELKQRGHEVILTRRGDVTLGLTERVDLANGLGADLFISVHANSMPTEEARARTHGVETYFLSADASDEAAAALAHTENADDGASPRASGDDAVGRILADLARSEAHVHSSRLAYEIHERLVLGTGARNRGVRQAPFVVLEGASMPAILVEVGYISHPREGKRLADPRRQAEIASSIASGIDSFFHSVLGRKGPGFQVPPDGRIE